MDTLFDDLPEFETRRPVGTSLSLSGAVDRRTRPFRIGDRIALVVECAVTGVEHKETKGGIVRVHKLAVGDAYELGGDRKSDLLEELHEEYVAFEDAMAARQPLPFGDGDEEPHGQDAAAGGGPEARAAAREDGDDGWDGFDPEPKGEADGPPPVDEVAEARDAKKVAGATKKAAAKKATGATKK